MHYAGQDKAEQVEEVWLRKCPGWLGRHGHRGTDTRDHRSGLGSIAATCSPQRSCTQYSTDIFHTKGLASQARMIAFWQIVTNSSESMMHPVATHGGSVVVSLTIFQPCWETKTIKLLCLCETIFGHVSQIRSKTPDDVWPARRIVRNGTIASRNGRVSQKAFC